MKKLFEMTQADYDKIIEASKPIPLLYISGGVPGPSPQDSANAAWEALGFKMGLKPYTVEPSRQGKFHFLAEPVEITHD